MINKAYLKNNLRPILVGAGSILILLVLYIVIEYRYLNSITSQLEGLTMNMVNDELRKNNLPQIEDINKEKVKYRLTYIGDNNYLLTVKLRTEKLTSRDYFFIVKRFSRFGVFNVQYHQVLLDLKTRQDIKYNFTENYKEP